MFREALRGGHAAHLLDQPRLADARLASHIDNAAAAPGKTGADDAVELIELGLAADKHAAVRRHRFARNAPQAPDVDGRCKSLQAKLAEIIADTATGQHAVNAFGNQRLAWTGGR